jgi:hypothetical protein
VGVRDSAPTGEMISAWLGVRAPAALVEVVALAYEVVGSAAAAEDALRWLLDGDLVVASEGMWRELSPVCYVGMPREFVPLIWYGVDGVQYGYVVRESERDAGDWPVARFCPMESGPLTLVGRDTREAIETLISEALDSVHEWGDPEPDPRLLALVRERLGIEPAREKASRFDGPDGEGIAVPVNTS